mgnify:CR=1 FL=1
MRSAGFPGTRSRGVETTQQIEVLTSGSRVGLNVAKSVRSTQFQLVTRMFSDLISP